MAFGTLSIDKIVNSDGFTLGGSGATMKNRLINGAMVIDQRNAGATGTGTSTYATDRWKFDASQSSKWTWGQNLNSVTPPAGFTNYLGVESDSAYSVSSSDYFVLRQFIEGYNTADFAWGSANAKTVTLSFWVRSSLTGTFGGAFSNSTYGRCYPFTYTITSADTWEYKTVVVSGDTSGTWLTTNGKGVTVEFGLGVGTTYSGTPGAWSSSIYDSATGAVSLVGTNGATWYITGVQLEVGSQATSFDYRQYGTELALCQRYYQLVSGIMGSSATSALCVSSINFPVQMRTSPSVGVTGAMVFSDFSASDFTQSSADVSIGGGGTRVNNKGVVAVFGNFSGMTTNRPAGNLMNSNSLTLSAEL